MPPLPKRQSFVTAPSVALRKYRHKGIDMPGIFIRRMKLCSLQDHRIFGISSHYMHNKSGLRNGSRFTACQILALLGSTNGAGTCASAAGNAGICIDNVLAFALRNSGNGALFDACAASDALISNNICHDLHLQVFSGTIIHPTVEKSNIKYLTRRKMYVSIINNMSYIKMYFYGG